jgi:ATP-dependent helicase HrpB
MRDVAQSTICNPQSEICNPQSTIRNVELPVDAFVPRILEHVRRSRAAVVIASPGAGKTTRIPPALAVDGPVIVLQPRRVSARSLAKRVAAEQGWTIGAEVGWHVRFERQFGPRTRVLFATEGILTARLHRDPLLTGFSTIVLDEFHERSVHADLGLALAKQAWRARDDLRLVVTSATLDPLAVAAYLDDCPIVDVPGALHPLDVRHTADLTLPAAVDVCLREARGNVLCFLPGAGEIGRASRDLAAAWRGDPPAEVVELHGSLDASSQDRAIEASRSRRVILATNIAETALTVPGVDAVVDSGLHKVARYDPERAVDSLETERITRDAADQRAGRAGRLGPGLVIRLWSRTDRLGATREPEIHRVDLSGVLLDVLAWNGNPRSFEWFEAPAPDRVASALDLLTRLGAVRDGRLTDAGGRMQALPLNPRLSAILLAAGGAREAALACALLSERSLQPSNRAGTVPTTTSDLFGAVERERDLPPHVRRVADRLQELLAGGRTLDETAFRRALLAGYPDRVARRRAPGSPRVLLASGHGAVVGPESGVRDGEFLLAIDVSAGRRGEGSEARIRIASLIEREWLTPTSTRDEHTFDAASGRVRAAARDYYEEIVLAEHPTAPDPRKAAPLLAQGYLSQPLSEEDAQIVRRMRFAGMPADVQALAERAVRGRTSLEAVDLGHGLTDDERRRLELGAPSTIPVPSGRRVTLEYRDDGSVVAAVKLQELFGLADTPRVGSGRAPVLLELLAPNGRPVQTTRDLRSFWERTYPQVRKELRGRYPKHPWPEDPWTAPPTARTTRHGVKHKD